jgi:hypothetical protein
VSYTVDNNTANCISRTGTLTIAGQTFTITQAAGTGSYAIAPTNRTHGSGAEAAAVNVTAGNGCAWTTGSNAGWITISSGGSGTGNGVVGYTLSVNATGSTRVGTLTIAGQTFTVTQTACSYSLSASGASYPATGGSGSVALTADSQCPWTADSVSGWITITSAASGTGSGTVGYGAQPNPTSNVRTGIVTVAGQTFRVTQDANIVPQVTVSVVAPITWPVATVNLVATATDDGAPYGTFNTVWSKVSGPGTVSFGNPNAVNTTATFSTSGMYGLRLTASDGAASASKDVTVVVNLRPVISAPPVVTNAAALVGNAVIVLVDTNTCFHLDATDPDGGALSCLWDFGDGSTSTDCNPCHVFTNCGPQTVSVSISDGIATNGATKTVAVACQLTITSLRAKLNFAKANADSCKLTGLPDLPAGFVPSGQSVIVDVGGAQVSFTLNAKGQAVSYQGTCRLSFNGKTGHWNVTANLRKGFWQTPWAAHGLINTTVPAPGLQVTLPVILVIGDEAVMSERVLLYTAKAGKSGTAK